MNEIRKSSLTNQYEYKNHVPFSEDDDITFFHAVLLDDPYEYQRFSQFEPENIFYRSSNQPLEHEVANQIPDNRDLKEESNVLVKLFGLGIVATALFTAFKKLF